MIEDTLGSLGADLEDCIPHNFQRVGPGLYQFGTKKITAQILTGSLVVRVGGGFMRFEEFVAKYGRSESIKIVKSTGSSLRTTLVRKQGKRSYYFGCYFDLRSSSSCFVLSCFE
jgi:hypothetical protein